MNINNALTPEYQNKSFHELLHCPLDAFQGLSDRAISFFRAMGIRTIGALGQWTPFIIARTIANLAGSELIMVADDVIGAPSARSCNIHLGLMPEFQDASLNRLLLAPPNAIQDRYRLDLADPLGIPSILALANWKYAVWANAILEAVRFEARLLS